MVLEKVVSQTWEFHLFRPIMSGTNTKSCHAKSGDRKELYDVYPQTCSQARQITKRTALLITFFNENIIWKLSATKQLKMKMAHGDRRLSSPFLMRSPSVHFQYLADYLEFLLFCYLFHWSPISYYSTRPPALTPPPPLPRKETVIVCVYWHSLAAKINVDLLLIRGTVKIIEGSQLRLIFCPKRSHQ